jgi:hypothetical protein
MRDDEPRTVWISLPITHVCACVYVCVCVCVCVTT